MKAPHPPIFGQALAEVLARAPPGTEVPPTLVSLFTYLRTHMALGAKGLFQGQVNFTRVRDIIERLNAGDPVTYRYVPHFYVVLSFF